MLLVFLCTIGIICAKVCIRAMHDTLFEHGSSSDVTSKSAVVPTAETIMPGIGVFGNITLEEIQLAISKCFPERNIKICVDFDAINNILSASGDDIALTPSLHTPQEYRSSIEKKDKQIRDLESASNKALLSIQTLHKQQQALFDEFVLLRQRYDEQKNSLLAVLWNQCSQYHPDLKNIPQAVDESTFEESETRIGHFLIGDALGEGQFATVRTCWKEADEKKEYALKIIKKERITTFNLLKRVSNEIEILQKLRNPNIVSIESVIQSATKLYIITEKGGSDLFEFFDEHPDGVPEKWAREIISQVLKGVLYCHEHGVCHRDLKPENILLIYDPIKEVCIDLKLCDFGLSTRYSSKTLLTDFCGSPGFFAPEMIIHGSYFGDKADLWSIGCILLELVLGHERFCDAWMTAYDYEILQDKNKFTAEINEAVCKLPSILDFSAHLNDFIISSLTLRSTERLSTRGACMHPWFDGCLEKEIRTFGRDSDHAATLHHDLSISPSEYSSGKLHIAENSEILSPRQGHVTQEALRQMYVEDRERRQIVEYINSQEDDKLEIHLPPIEPATPSLVKARKILTKGTELAQRASEGQWSPMATPMKTGSGGSLTNTFGSPTGSFQLKGPKTSNSSSNNSTDTTSLLTPDHGQPQHLMTFSPAHKESLPDLMEIDESQFEQKSGKFSKSDSTATHQSSS